MEQFGSAGGVKTGICTCMVVFVHACKYNPEFCNLDVLITCGLFGVILVVMCCNYDFKWGDVGKAWERLSRYFVLREHLAFLGRCNVNVKILGYCKG